MRNTLVISNEQMRDVSNREKFISFINKIELNIRYGNVQLNLMDLFPLLKKGIVVQRTIEHILYVYVLFHDLLDIYGNLTLDKPLNDLFKGYVSIPLIMDELCKRFNDNIQGTFLLDNYSTASVEKGVLYCLLDFLEFISINSYDIENIMDGPNCIYKDSSIDNIEDLQDILITHPRINNLYRNIYNNNEEEVIMFLKSINPLDNNFVACIFALTRHNKNITNLVFDNAVLRILLYKECIQVCIGNVFNDVWPLIYRLL